jgi:hypothetical protein
MIKVNVFADRQACNDQRAEGREKSGLIPALPLQ